MTRHSQAFSLCYFVSIICKCPYTKTQTTVVKRAEKLLDCLIKSGGCVVLLHALAKRWDHVLPLHLKFQYIDFIEYISVIVAVQ